MTMDDRGAATIALVAGLVALAIGAGLLYYGQSAAEAEEQALENAVEIEVEILETDIETRQRTTSSDEATRRETVYRPTVRYAYEFEGEQYESTNVYPQGGFQEYSERSQAESKLSEYREGTVVTGYVDPNDPGEAFLIREKSGAPQIMMIVGGFFALFGLVTLALGYRRGR